MMVALLLYGCSRGVHASRRLAQAFEERVDLMAVTGLSRPDLRTVSDLRKRRLGALSGLFVQVLRPCQAAGLVKPGRVAVDGTKPKANASRHKAMGYGRMKRAAPALEAEVAAWLARAEAADAAHQIIVAQRLATNPADYRALVALVDGVRAGLGRQPK